MAEIGIAASVIGIVGFALDLSKKLYTFATTTSVAGEEVEYIAKNVTNFADALELLAERLDEDNEPIYSHHTVRLVHNLYDQSCDLFDKIEELIPSPKNGRDGLNFAQKFAWNFKKGRVEFLAGQIECLKTTTSLVATVLFAGKRIRSKKSSRRRKHKKASDQIDLDQVRQRVTIAVVEQQQASNRMFDLQERAVAEERLALQGAESGPSRHEAEAAMELRSLIPLDDVSQALQLPNIFDADDAHHNQIILQENDDLMLHLVGRFTTLEFSEDSGRRHEKHASDRASEITSGYSGSDRTRPRSPILYSSNDQRTRTRPHGKANRQQMTDIVYDQQGEGKESREQVDKARSARNHTWETPYPGQSFDTRTNTDEEEEEVNDNIRAKRSRDVPYSNTGPQSRTDASTGSNNLKRSSYPHPYPFRPMSSTRSSDEDQEADSNDSERHHEQGRNYIAQSSFRATPNTPYGRIQALHNLFHDKWEPECSRFVSSVPEDPNSREKEYRRLSESVMRYIILAADAIELEGDSAARSSRKLLVSKAQEWLKVIDQCRNLGKLCD